MIHVPRWKILLVIAISLLSILYCVPTFLDKGTREWIKTSVPSWVPAHSIRLGLDLQGGSHLLLEVDTDSVVRQRAEDVVNSVRTESRKEGIAYSALSTVPNGMKMALKDPAQADAARR